MLVVALVTVHVIICFILIAVILLQAGRGQGFTGSTFAGSNVQSIFGTRSADILTKATTIAAVLFLFTCIGLDILEARRSRSLFDTGRPTAPVDLQQIQKVLEKIKAEGNQAPPAAGDTKTAQALEAKKPVEEAPPAQETPAPAIPETK